jgi:hypothetical protein
MFLSALPTYACDGCARCYTSPGRFDELSNYDNDRSLHLAAVRGAIERSWQAWEAEQFARVAEVRALDVERVKAELEVRFARDVRTDGPPTDFGRYCMEDMTVDGYKCVLCPGGPGRPVCIMCQLSISSDVRSAVLAVLSDSHGTVSVRRVQIGCDVFR